jgi:hypothetical protein
MISGSNVSKIDDQGFQLVGGQAVQTTEFTSTGKLVLSDGFCTATRIGPRHFATAAHCLPSNEVTLVSHKDKNEFTYSAKTLVYQLASGSPTGNLTDMLNGERDFAMFSVQFKGDLRSVIESRYELNQSFDTRKVRDGWRMKRNETVLVAGWGLTSSGSPLWTCDVNGCQWVSSTLTESPDLRSAFFKISATGTDYPPAAISQESFRWKGETAIFNSKGQKPGEAAGATANGDSGGPVLNGDGDLVGVVAGAFVPKGSGGKIYARFAGIDTAQVNEKKASPALDYVTSSPTVDDPIAIVVGYNLNQVTFKTDLGTSVTPNSDCRASRNPDIPLLFDPSMVYGSDYLCFDVSALNGARRLDLFHGSENLGRSISISAGCSQPYYVNIMPAPEVLDSTFRTEVTFQYANKAPVTEVGFVTNYNGSLYNPNPVTGYGLSPSTMPPARTAKATLMVTPNYYSLVPWPDNLPYWEHKRGGATQNLSFQVKSTSDDTVKSITLPVDLLNDVIFNADYDMSELFQKWVENHGWEQDWAFKLTAVGFPPQAIFQFSLLLKLQFCQ